jgi:hypothetical protein
MTEHVHITERAEPLLSTIALYRAGCDTFHRTGGGEDAMLTAHDRLCSWREPAGSRESALAALKLIRDGDMIEDDAGHAMLAAVIGYLEGAHRLGSGKTEANSANLTPEEAAVRMGAATVTLQRWRSNGTGPKYIKRGGRIFYRPQDIEDFERENERSQTRRGIVPRGAKE